MGSELSHLKEEELAEVLHRAQEIDVGSLTGATDAHDLEQFIAAAEEVGISREAVLQAIREKTGQALQSFNVGDRVFAKSADNAYYIATVTEVDGRTAKVRFLSGGDHALAVADLHSASFLPGQKVEVDWPFWGWYKATVVKFDERTGKLTANDGMSEKSFPLTKVRLGVRRSQTQARVSSLLFRTALIAGSLGAVAGALVARFLGF